MAAPLARRRVVWRRLRRHIAAALVVAAATHAALSASADAPSAAGLTAVGPDAGRVPPGDAGDVPTVLAWTLADDASRASLRKQTGVTVASPVRYRIAFGAAGPHLSPWSDAAPRLDTELVPVPRERHWPLVACGGACARALVNVLAKEAERATLARVLEQAASANGGVLLDVEGLRGDSMHYTQFIEDLSARLRPLGKKLALAVPPPCPRTLAAAERKTSSCVDPRGSYDFTRLAAAADALAVMFYDHDVTGTRPPQPRAWVDGSVAELFALVPPHHRPRLLFGVPLYGRIDGALFGRTDVLFRDIERRVVRGVPVSVSPLAFDGAALAARGSLTRTDGDGGTVTGTLFVEDHRSLRERLKMARTHGFGGVALWRLGGEDPCVATVLAAYRDGASLDVPCAAR